MPPKYFQIVTIPTTSDGKRWPVVAPIDCRNIVIKNGDPINALNIDTDPLASDQRQQIPGGAELVIVSNSATFPWPAGALVAYVSGASGNPVVVRFTV